MLNIGEELKAAREHRNLTIEDIHRVTKISIKHLVAMEEGRFNLLPEVYIRFFLKAYASAVGLDAVKVIEEYEKIYAKGRIEPAEAEVKPSPEEAPEKKIIDSVKWAKEHSKILKYVLAGLGGLIIIIVILLSLKTGSNKVNRGTAEPSHKLQLSIQVDRQVYLMVSMDGSDSSDYILQPEAPKDFLAETRIWVFSSDIGATRMILNGKNYGPLGASGWSGHFRVDSNGVNLIKTYPPLR